MIGIPVISIVDLVGSESIGCMAQLLCTGYHIVD
jgi:hypothetical protein